MSCLMVFLNSFQPNLRMLGQIGMIVLLVLAMSEADIIGRGGQQWDSVNERAIYPRGYQQLDTMNERGGGGGGVLGVRHGGERTGEGACLHCTLTVVKMRTAIYSSVFPSKSHNSHTRCIMSAKEMFKICPCYSL